MPADDALPIPLPLPHPMVLPGNDPVAPDIETASERYALRFSGDVGRYLLARQAVAVGALLDRLPREPLTVFDVGGGHAQLSETFALRGHHITVHGSSDNCFGRAAPSIARYPERITTRVGPLQKLPASDREFDLVCSIRLLAHVSDWRALLAEKCRVARRYVICEFPTHEGVQRVARPLHPIKVRMEPDTRTFSTLTITEVARVLAGHGFRVVQVERQFVLPIALHRALRAPSLTGGAEALLELLGITGSIGSPVILLAECTS
jgi:ubiquinone/menaquinone biosynthesis C-methylase UbiE